MPKLSEIYQELDFVSDRISTQVRQIALGVLAVAWLFLVGGKDKPPLPAPPGRLWLLGVAAVSIAVLVADYLQYVFGYWATNAVRRKAEAAKQTATEFNLRDLRYRARTWLFWLKQVLAMMAVAGLAVAIIQALHA